MNLTSERWRSSWRWRHSRTGARSRDVATVSRASASSHHNDAMTASAWMWRHQWRHRLQTRPAPSDSSAPGECTLHHTHHAVQWQLHTTTHSTYVLPKVIWEERVARAQLRSEVPIGYNGMTQIHPKTAPSPSTITTPSNTPVPWPNPFTTSNVIRIRFATIHFPDRQTDTVTHTQTDRWDKRQVYSNSAYAVLYSRRTTR